MQNQEFRDLATELYNRSRAMWDRKCTSYALGDVDVLRNFRVVAELLGDPSGAKKAAFTYAAKHFLAIASDLARSDDGGEGIEDRLVDLLNFIFVIYALEKEPYLR